MPRISIIVPVYNTENYLSKCLNSILSQTFDDFEIIIVNDGSPDNSDNLIKEYVQKYPEKIKYIQKENGGLSDARNFGIEQASGDYISFVDSDDYIDINLFQTLLPYLEQEIDIIKFKAIKVNSNFEALEKINGPVFQSISGEEAFNKLCFSDVFLEPSWLYLYKNSFFKGNSFKFAKNLYHEDFGLTPLVILKADTVCSVDFYGYYYVQVSNSIVRNSDYSKTVKRANDLLIHYDNMINTIKKYNLSEVSSDNVKLYYTNAILNALKCLKSSEKELYIQDIKKKKLIENIKTKNPKQFLKKYYYKYLKL